MDYQTLLERLYRMRGGKLDLSTMHQLARAMSHPERAYPVVHVGGTNGKGSVATKVAKGLELSGLRVGLYTSPHLRTYRERIQINGELIEEGEVVRGLREIFHLIDEHELFPTFFEVTTALAFLYFAKQEVDVAVIEVGLGGRLDATNIVRPLLSVVTSIGLDHTNILGERLEQIAKEKAGIIKQGVPAVIGPRATGFGLNGVEVTGAYSDYLEENDLTARKALELLQEPFSIPQEALEAGLAVLPPCRFEERGRVLLDVAHNIDALRSLIHALRVRFPEQPFRLLFGLSHGRPSVDLLKVVRESGLPHTLVNAKHERVVDTDDGIPLSQALETDWEERPVVCGSCYLMDEALAILEVLYPEETRRSEAAETDVMV